MLGHTSLGASHGHLYFGYGTQLANPRQDGNIMLNSLRENSRKVSIPVDGNMERINALQTSPVSMEQQYGELWDTNRSHQFPKIQNQVRILDRAGMGTYGQEY